MKRERERGSEGEKEKRQKKEKKGGRERREKLTFEKVLTARMARSGWDLA